MSDVKKANEDLLNSLHLMTAMKLAQLLKESEGEPELMLKILQQCRGFLKDNEVTADIKTSVPLREIAAEIKVEELPFKLTEVKESN